MQLDETLTAIAQTPGADLSGLSVAVYARGDICYEFASGCRTIARPGAVQSQPVTPSTKFRVASISKTVTALAVMQLVEAGGLALDADVGDYLGWPLRNPHWPDRPITTRMLLTHTSSLRDGAEYMFPLSVTLESVFEAEHKTHEGTHFAAPTDGADRAPGCFFEYCNLGFGVMGTLIESISSERFDLYVDRHVLAPLGVDASFNVHNLSDAGFAELATLYRRQRDGVWAADAPWCAQVDDYCGIRPAPPAGLDEYIPGVNGTLFSPQGGLRISARDLVKVMKLFLQGGEGAKGSVLAPATVKQILTDQWRFDPLLGNGEPYGGLMRAFGLGIHHVTNAPADRFGPGDRIVAGPAPELWGHTGDAHGLLSAMLFDPVRDLGFVYMIGGTGCNPETYKGVYSGFYRWEEQIQTALFNTLLAGYYR